MGPRGGIRFRAGRRMRCDAWQERGVNGRRDIRRTPTSWEPGPRLSAYVGSTTARVLARHLDSAPTRRTLRSYPMLHRSCYTCSLLGAPPSSRLARTFAGCCAEGHDHRAWLSHSHALCIAVRDQRITGFRAAPWNTADVIGTTEPRTRGLISGRLGEIAPVGRPIVQAKACRHV